MRQTLLKGIVAIPGILAGLLSCAACPMCFPIYVTVITFLGASPNEASIYIQIIMYASLLTGLWIMSSSVHRKKKGYINLLFAIISALGIIYGRNTGNMPFLYIGLAAYFSVFLLSKYSGKPAHQKETNAC